VSQAFASKGHDVLSCDLLPCSLRDFSNVALFNHHLGDVLSLDHSKFDLMICFPPCTWLAQCQLHRRTLGAQLNRQRAFAFVLRLWHSKCPRVVIENPIGWLNTNWMSPDQITSPHFYGSAYHKPVCLWLRGVPPLMDTYVTPGTKRVANHVNSRMSQASKRIIKSKFFPEMATAMATQWTEEYLLNH